MQKHSARNRKIKPNLEKKKKKKTKILMQFLATIRSFLIEKI